MTGHSPAGSGDPRRAKTRYSSGRTATKYQYTGQYSYTADFGLHFYNARWYDSSLGRFAQADTIIPPAQGVQGWDRYAYTNNNPIRYTDPTGHRIDDGCRTEGCSLTALQKAKDAQKLAELKYDPSGQRQKRNRELAEAILYGGTELALGVLFEPADWAMTAYHCANGDCSPLMLLGLLPVIPSTLGRQLDNLCSFSADTPVTTSEGEVSIAAIEIGDHVLAWNEADGTLGYYEVTAVFSHADEVLTELIIGGEWIETTPEHPFYTQEEGWLPADELRTGMRVRQADGDYHLVWLKWNIYRTQEMYNLTVDTAHTFFVGEGQWLVHNACDLLSRLPVRNTTHDPTTGILVAQGQEITFTSGKYGPGQDAPRGKGTGYDSYTRTHVEGHASAWMRQNKVNEATLYINNPPCTNCNRNLPRMLPPNSILDIFGPNGYFKRFFSSSE